MSRPDDKVGRPGDAGQPIDEAENATLDLIKIYAKASATSTALEFLRSPTHALAADLMIEAAAGRIISDNLDGQLWIKAKAGHSEEIDAPLSFMRSVLEIAVDQAFNQARTEGDTDAGKLWDRAKRKVQTRDFLASSLTLFSEVVAVQDLAAKWNSTPETLPCIDGILDFSLDARPSLREPMAGEYFENPLPCRAWDIMTTKPPAKFLAFLEAVFPDHEIRETALDLLSLVVANLGHRVFGIFFGPTGSNGKDLLIEILAQTLPGRAGFLSGAAICRNANDGGAKRFAGAELEGKLLAAVDEVTAPLDVAEIKRLSGGSTITVERKGQDPHEIRPAWLIIALTNKLPAFAPATDTAFLQRLVITPFDSTFYTSEEQRDEYQKLGIPAENLRPAGNREALLDEMKAEREGIISLLVTRWIEVRKAGGRPRECQRCLILKRQYSENNDLTAQFFIEYFERNDAGRVEYARLLELWREFTGDKNASTREVVKKLTERFNFIERKQAHGLKFLAGISELWVSGEPKTTIFHPEETNHQKVSSERENPLFGSPDTREEATAEEGRR